MLKEGLDVKMTGVPISLSPLFLLLPFLPYKARLSLPQLTPLCVFQFIGLCDTQILSHIFLCRVGTIFLLQWLFYVSGNC
jgi:hypothetical protein